MELKHTKLFKTCAELESLIAARLGGGATESEVVHKRRQSLGWVWERSCPLVSLCGH